MAREQYFTISQLKGKDPDYRISDSDLVFGTIGTGTAELSSAKISLQQIGRYIIETFPTKLTFSIAGSLSAAAGLSANGGAANPIHFQNIPTSSTGLKTGDVYTQLGSQIVAGGSASIKVMCIK